jgi:hypothetical protein
MTMRALTTAALLAAAVSLPAAAQIQPRPTSDTNESTRRICRIAQQIGTRLGAVRTCRTKSEWAEADLEARRTADRIQRSTSACMMGPNAPGQAHVVCSN